MKPSLSFSFLIPIVLVSCQLLDPPLSMGQPRQEHGSAQSGVQTPAEPDTSLIVTALCFPPSYDWRKDSLYGRVECTLKLFRNGEEVLALQAGPGTQVSTSLDGHHLIDGRLYTEFSGPGGTSVRRDGELLASWPGTERLCGLLERQGVLHTLGSGPGGLVYRRGGAEILRVADGVPFGGFRQDGYGQSGALYQQDSAVCFCFLSSRDGTPKVFVSRDGEPGAVLGTGQARVLDARLLDGTPAVFLCREADSYLVVGRQEWSMTYLGGMIWDSASLVMLDGQPAVLGRYRYAPGSEPVWCIGRPNMSMTVSGKPACFFIKDGSEVIAVSEGREIPDGCYFPGRDCACLSPDGALTVALSPKDMSARPYVLCRGEVREYPVHGFITSVSYHISY